MLLIILLLLGVNLFSLIDACSTSKSAWELAKKDKALWIVLIVLFGIFASIVYLAAVRPELTKHN